MVSSVVEAAAIAIAREIAAENESDEHSDPTAPTWIEEVFMRGYVDPRKLARVALLAAMDEWCKKASDDRNVFVFLRQQQDELARATETSASPELLANPRFQALLAMSDADFEALCHRDVVPPLGMGIEALREMLRPFK